MKYLKRNNLYLILYQHVYLVICLFMVTGVFGQNNTTATHQLAIQQDDLQQDSLFTIPADSTSTLWQKKLDSLRTATQWLGNAVHSVDSLGDKQLAGIMALKQQSDSIYNQLEAKQNAVSAKITTIEKKISAKQDSLHNAITAKLKSITARPSKLSVGSINNPVDSQWQKVKKYLPKQQQQLQQQKVSEIGSKKVDLDKKLSQLKQYQVNPEFSKELNVKLKELQGLQQEKQQLGSLNEQLTKLKDNYGNELDKLGELGEFFKIPTKAERCNRKVKRLSATSWPGGCIG